MTLYRIAQRLTTYCSSLRSSQFVFSFVFQSSSPHDLTFFKEGEAERGAKDGRSAATTVYCLELLLITFHSSLLASPLIPTPFAIRFAHCSLDLQSGPNYRDINRECARVLHVRAP